MSVAIRLRREGAKNRPYYRIIVADQRKKLTGRYLEQLGTYDPKKEGENWTIKLDRADYWTGVGAKASETVASIIKKARRKAKSEAPAEPAAA